MTDEKQNEPKTMAEGDDVLEGPEKAILDRITALETENGRLKSKIALFEKLQPVKEVEPKKPTKTPEERVLKELEKRGWIF